MPPGAVTAFLILALLNNVIPFVLFAWAQQEITGGLASILNATTPIWGVIVAHLFTADEKATPGKVAGVLLGFGGVAVMIGADFLGEHRTRSCGRSSPASPRRSAMRWPASGRAASGPWASPPIAVATGQLTAATLVMLPLVLLFEPPWLAAAPSRRGLGRAGGAGPVLHQPRLHPLFPPARLGRRDQLAARHLPDPGHRDPARRAAPRRAAGAAPLRRHGADRRGAGGDRRATVRRRQFAAAAPQLAESDKVTRA